MPDQVVLASLRRDWTDPLLRAYSDHRVRTGADGSFRLVGLPADVMLSIQSHGQSWQGTYAGPFRLEDGEVREGTDLVTDRSANLTITVDRTPEKRHTFSIELRLMRAFSQGTPDPRKVSTKRRVEGIQGGTRSATALDLTPGRYKVEWKIKSRVVASEEVDVLLDVDNQVSLTE